MNKKSSSLSTDADNKKQRRAFTEILFSMFHSAVTFETPGKKIWPTFTIVLQLNHLNIRFTISIMISVHIMVVIFWLMLVIFWLIVVIFWLLLVISRKTEVITDRGRCHKCYEFTNHLSESRKVSRNVVVEPTNKLSWKDITTQAPANFINVSLISEILWNQSSETINHPKWNPNTLSRCSSLFITSWEHQTQKI